MTDDIKGTLFLRPTQLIMTVPDGQRQVVPLLAEVVRIGRGSEGNDVVLPNEFKSISRRHFEIRRESGSFVLLDLDSGNGVYVNGQKVDTVYLKDGDEIRIGNASDNQEVHIRIQIGTEFLASAETAEQVTLPPTFALSNSIPEIGPYLSIRFPNGSVKYFSILQNITTVGRGAENSLSLPYRFISARHFELRQAGNNFTITDLKSTNGTLINNKPLIPNEPQSIHNDTIIRIGDDAFGSSIGFTFFNPLEEQAPQDGFVMAAPTLIVEQSKPVSIGRAHEADVRLDAPDVSRKHASIYKLVERYFLSDLDSTNGTFVNNERVHSTELHDGDLIEIGKFLLVFANGQVTPYQSNGM